MRLIILGAGGYGHTIGDMAGQLDTYEEIGYLDDRGAGSRILGKCNTFSDYIRDDTEFYPALGNNQLRREWLDRLEKAGCRIATLIHPTAYCSPSATICPGAAVLPKAIVNTDCVIQRGCIINLGAIVDHGCIVGECAHICLGAIVKAENRIPDCIKIEAGTIIENRTYPL